MSLPMDEKILKYVPKRLQKHVEGCAHDDDGYWVWFDEEVENSLYESSTLHEDTISDLQKALKECKVKA